MSDLTIAFRPGTNADVPYLKSTWLHSFRNGEGARDIPNTVYYKYEGAILTYVIPRCSNQGGVVVAYEDQGPDASWAQMVDADILGYIVAEEFEGMLLVHMTYVRGYNKPGKKSGNKYRRRGIATELLREVQRKLGLEGKKILYTYRTEMCWQAYAFRKALKRIDADYVLYPKYTLLPGGWETGMPQSG